MIYLLSAVGLTPGGSSTVHIYTQTHRTTQSIHRTTQLNTEQQYMLMQLTRVTLHDYC